MASEAVEDAEDILFKELIRKGALRDNAPLQENYLPSRLC
jgi:hypothetical protein